VLRETTVEHIASRDVVPGDIVLIEEGDTVPADGRLFECFHLEVDEALLTGEAVPVVKRLK
jgi:P-type E1-E2 ATPase